MNELIFQSNHVKSNRILYTPSALAKKSLIHLQETGELEAIYDYNSHREHLDSFLFFVVVNGSGTIDYHKQTISLHKGDCVFLNCNSSYTLYSSTPDPWKLKWVHFNGAPLQSIYDAYFSEEDFWHLSPSNIRDYEVLLQDILFWTQGDALTRDMILYEKLLCLLNLIIRDHTNTHSGLSPKNSDLVLDNVKQFLDYHYTEKINLDSLSQQFFINKYYLTRIFKKRFGSSINVYVNQLRITKAKQLLRFTNESIESISLLCGIEDSAYFTRLFHKTEGSSPREYRNSWLK